MIPLKDDNPTAITPFVTIAMIALCVLAFIWQLGLGIACGAFLFWVIDPKLKAVSVEYEQRQADYLHRLETRMHWRETVDRLTPGSEGV